MRERAPGRLRTARRITVLTGAGISTDSGIPDFRGPQGVWTRDPEAEKLSTLHYYVADPGIRRRARQERLRHSFGQSLDAAVIEAAAQAAGDCDVFLAVGTSLTVHPAAGLTDVAAAHGAGSSSSTPSRRSTTRSPTWWCGSRSARAAAAARGIT